MYLAKDVIAGRQLGNIKVLSFSLLLALLHLSTGFVLLGWEGWVLQGILFSTLQNTRRHEVLLYFEFLVRHGK